MLLNIDAMVCHCELAFFASAAIQFYHCEGEQQEVANNPGKVSDCFVARKVFRNYENVVTIAISNPCLVTEAFMAARY